MLLESTYALTFLEGWGLGLIEKGSELVFEGLVWFEVELLELMLVLLMLIVFVGLKEFESAGAFAQVVGDSFGSVPGSS